MASSKTELMQSLLKLGENNPDFTISTSNDSDLLLERKIVDVKYYGLASEEKVAKTYRAKIWLDEGAREVKYQEILADQSRNIGILPSSKLEFKKSIFKGKVLFQKEKSVAFGFKEPFDPKSFGKVYDYSFDVETVRDPVRRTVENAGWKFNQVILGQY